MAGRSIHGPTLTYVTDPALPLAEQRQVFREFVRCANDHELRVALRLPQVSDDEIGHLVTWYMELINAQGVSRTLLPPLVHYRPLIAGRYAGTGLWLPARAIHDGLRAAAYSVHTGAEATAAMRADADEVIFGHVFATDSHPGDAGRGVLALKEIGRAFGTVEGRPLVTAIGGIDEQSVRGIGRVGVRSVACIRAISRSPDIPRTLSAMQQQWIVGYNEFLQKGHTT